MIEVEQVCKSFLLHQQNGVHIPVLREARLHAAPGECVALTGASGSGKSTLMRLVYGNYRAGGGRITVGGVDVVSASAREILRLRQTTMGYVSQFLRVLPRVPTIRLVAEPLIRSGEPEADAKRKAAALLDRLRIPEPLHALSPLTFSGGEQQRVNIARGFIRRYPAMLLDEPTASLDDTNRGTALELIREAKDAGAAIIGIFHDADVRAQVADREVDVSQFA